MHLLQTVNLHIYKLAVFRIEDRTTRNCLDVEQFIIIVIFTVILNCKRYIKLKRLWFNLFHSQFYIQRHLQLILGIVEIYTLWDSFVAVAIDSSASKKILAAKELKYSTHASKLILHICFFICK